MSRILSLSDELYEILLFVWVYSQLYLYLFMDDEWEVYFSMERRRKYVNRRYITDICRFIDLIVRYDKFELLIPSYA